MRHRVLYLFGFAALMGMAHSARCGTYPQWWFTRGVVATNAAITNDYAAVNQGEVKWIASNAAAEMEAGLPGGAGSNVLEAISHFSQSNNYAALNLGQLKNLAKPFYDRLVAVGYASSYPWTDAAQTNDYALANVGQVKNLFCFDLTQDTDSDGLPDWWEMANFDILAYGPNDDPDGDGITDLQEYQNGSNPSLSDDWLMAWFGDLNHFGPADPDGDGLNNFQEFQMGTDPTKPNGTDSNNVAELTIFTPREN